MFGGSIVQLMLRGEHERAEVLDERKTNLEKS